MATMYCYTEGPGNRTLIDSTPAHRLQSCVETEFTRECGDPEGSVNLYKMPVKFSMSCQIFVRALLLYSHTTITIQWPVIRALFLPITKHGKS